MELTVSERVRRALPWKLMPLFHNAVTSLELDGARLVLSRRVEVYTTRLSGLFIPGAATLLYLPYFRADLEPAEDGTIRVENPEGFVRGYAPDGRQFVYSVKSLYDRITHVPISYSGEFNLAEARVVARNVMRLVAGRFFASNVLYHMRKYGVVASPVRLSKRVEFVIIKEGKVSARLPMNVNVYQVRCNDASVISPGIVPGVATLFSQGKIPALDGKATDALEELLREIKRVGKRVSPINILQSTSKTRFSYYIGEADLEGVRPGKNKRFIWLAGDRVSRGVNVNLYVDTRQSKALLSVQVWPFNPPATLVLNYPPFNIAPLCALYNDRYHSLAKIIARAEERAERLGIRLGLFYRDYEVLRDARLGIDDVKRILREGYPRPETLLRAASRIERLGDVADLASMALGPVEKIDNVLISKLPGEEARRTAPREEEGELLL